MTSPFSPSSDESPVTHPGLAGIVEAARRQSTPPVGITIGDIRDEAAKRRRAWWRNAGIAVAAAAVAVVSWNLVVPAGPTAPETTTVPTVARSQAPDGDRAEDQPVEADPADAQAGRDIDDHQRVPAAGQHAAIALADGIEVRPLETSSVADIEVLGTYSARVAGGVYHVVVPEDASEPLLVHVSKRRLAAQPGTTLELRVGDEVSFEVSHGQARWLDDDATTDRGKRRTNKPSELAAKADARLAAGDRNAAISILESLVKQHPRSSAARAGLLDLARLYRAKGELARAGCAYRLYLERWPTTSLRDDVQAALDRLGSAAEGTCPP